MNSYVVTGVLLLALDVGVAMSQETDHISFAPLAEEYGVGYVTKAGHPAGIFYSKHDGATISYIGSRSEISHWESAMTWALYDVSAFPAGSELTGASVTIYIHPDDDSYNLIQYIELTVDPRMEDPDAIMSSVSNTNYGTSHLLPPVQEGEVVGQLGESAVAAIESAIESGGLFAIALIAEGERMALDGWMSAQPLLTVTYRTSVPIAVAAWGRVKALFQ